MFDKEIIKLNEDLNEELSNSEAIDLATTFLLEKKEASATKACKLYNYLNYENENIDKEIERLQILKKANDKKINSIKNYVFLCSEELGYKNFDTFKVSTRKSKSVEIDEVRFEDIPQEFIRTTTIKNFDKTKIKEYLESPAIINQETGEVIPNKLNWARIVEKTNITIK
jgi:hypothetical protein